MSQTRVRSIATAALFAAACQKADPAPAGIERSVRLHAASSCDELTTQIQDAAVRLMRAQLDAAKSGSFFTEGAGPGTATPAGGAPSPSAPPASYSTTNTQVAGVDEGDF